MRGRTSNHGDRVARDVDGPHLDAHLEVHLDVDLGAALEHRMSVDADMGNLASLRSQTKAFVRQGGGGSDLAEDFGLAVSELATNVVQHSDAEYITVTLRRDEESWQLEVDAAEGVPEIDTVAAPEPSIPTGRGLVVVRAIMDDVRVVDVGGTPVLRCVKLART